VEKKSEQGIEWYIDDDRRKVVESKPFEGYLLLSREEWANKTELNKKT
jgi:hypothetical protein